MHKVAAPMLSAGIALTAFVGLAQASYAAQTPVDTGIVRVDYTSDADTTPAPQATTQQATPQSSRSPMSIDLRSNPSRTPLVKTDDKYKKDLEFLKNGGIDKQKLQEGYESGTTWFWWASCVVGWLIAFIFASFALVTMIDLVYLNIGFMRNILGGGHNASGGSPMPVGGIGGMGAPAPMPSSSGGGRRFTLVSSDAISAMDLAETGGQAQMPGARANGSAKSATMIYLQKRFKTIVATIVVITLFVIGRQVQDVGINIGAVLANLIDYLIEITIGH